MYLCKGNQMAWFKSKLYHLPAMWLWKRYLTYLSLSFLICQTGQLIVLFWDTNEILPVKCKARSKRSGIGSSYFNVREEKERAGSRKPEIDTQISRRSHRILPSWTLPFPSFLLLQNTVPVSHSYVDRTSYRLWIEI